MAQPGTAWQRDNQFSYSTFLVNQHNREIHLDRAGNKGVFNAQYEDVDELVNVDVDMRPAVNDVTDLSEYPTFENFLPPETFREIVEQPPMEMSEICVAFPLQHQWQRLKELATDDEKKAIHHQSSSIACYLPRYDSDTTACGGHGNKERSKDSVFFVAKLDQAKPPSH